MVFGIAVFYNLNRIDTSIKIVGTQCPSNLIQCHLLKRRDILVNALVWQQQLAQLHFFAFIKSPIE